ncbi:hypothetical protein EDC53_104210 [Phytobacter diazotrophicus]|nr:hypothetical protein EDC53_104210 [Phytobacter diazotrophicus]
MEDFLNKISTYQIFNNLVPGAFFVSFIETSLNIDISGNQLIKSIIVYYIVGLVIGRIGSTILTPFLKLIKIVEYIPYKEFINASTQDEKINSLQESSGMYRNLLCMSLILFILCSIIHVCFHNKNMLIEIIVTLFLIMIFTLSYRKQVLFISTRISNRTTQKNQE